MIKLTKRRNIIYIVQIVIWSNLRLITKILLSKLYGFGKSPIFTFLMFFGEFSAGSIVYKYQSKYLRKKENAGIVAKNIYNNHFPLDIYHHKTNRYKISLLLFFAAFLDYIEFAISTFYINKFIFISDSLDNRCYSFLVICNAFAYTYFLKFNIFKHQIFSLIIILVCFIITIASETAFQNINEIFTYSEFTLSLGLIILEYFFLSMMDTIDKYLLEFESVDPFLIIIIEGFIGSILGIIFCIAENPFPEIKYIYNSNSSSSFILFIFLLFFYYIFGALRNSFRIMINKLYSPMVLTLSDYFLNPIYIIYNYIDGDFKSKNGQNIFYFVLNLILSILTVISTFIFNEFIVLFCFGFERNTYDQITRRSIDEKIEMRLYDNDEESDNDIKEEEIESKSGTYKITFN